MVLIVAQWRRVITRQRVQKPTFWCGQVAFWGFVTVCFRGGRAVNLRSQRFGVSHIFISWWTINSIKPGLPSFRDRGRKTAGHLRCVIWGRDRACRSSQFGWVRRHLLCSLYKKKSKKKIKEIIIQNYYALLFDFNQGTSIQFQKVTSNKRNKG